MEIPLESSFRKKLRKKKRREKNNSWYSEVPNDVVEY